MHKSLSDNGSRIIGLIIFIIIIIIIILLLIWAFNAGLQNSNSRTFCFRSGSNWTGHGVMQNVPGLGSDNASNIQLDLNVTKIYKAECGNKIVEVKYHWKLLDCDGRVINQNTDQAFGPIGHDGTAYLTEIREQALIKLTPLPDNQLEFVYTEFGSLDSTGKTTSVATLREVPCN